MLVSYPKRFPFCRKSFLSIVLVFAFITLIAVLTASFKFGSFKENANFIGINSEFSHSAYNGGRLDQRKYFEFLDRSESEELDDATMGMADDDDNGDTFDDGEQDAENDVYAYNSNNLNEDNYRNRLTEDQHTGSVMPRINETAVRRLPQAIIIGVKKCGTRALLEFLRIHPDIRAPGPEPHFFDRYYHRGLDWYRDQMPQSINDQITIEKTPRYFVSDDVPEKVFNMDKHIKILIVVRDPVIRAISDFAQGSSKGLSEGLTFEEKAFGSSHGDEVDTSWSAIQTGYYANHLRRWLRYFPFRQFHLVSGENLILDPAKEMEGVQDFLGLKRVISDKHFYFNETKGFPCLKKHEGSPAAKCFNNRKGRRHPYVAPDVIQRLRDFYRPFNEIFFSLTGRNFGWL